MGSARARTAAGQEIDASLRKLGRLIRQRRRVKGMTLSGLADVCVVSVPTLRKAERGDPTVGLGVVAAALWHLGLGPRLFALLLASGQSAGRATSIRTSAPGSARG